ncbi:MAG TPA: hypothetical protein VFV38_02850, partial [Ktedonobacteraceae bacterium]|nr:hypothetical protein [Ktedonobacteraceae bacterium]
WSANCQNDIAHISFEICFVTIWTGLFRKRFVFREMMSLADDISCYLNEAWMKGVSMLYHVQGIDPLRSSILFVELNTSFFFISQVNGCGD